MTHFFKANPPTITAEKQIYTANGGLGEANADELVVSSPKNTFVYKFFDGGWYRRNQVTKQDHFLGIGACPTLELSDLKLLDKKYFEEITFDPNEEIENVGTEI